jgi:hypothetical protein
MKRTLIILTLSMALWNSTAITAMDYPAWQDPLLQGYIEKTTAEDKKIYFYNIAHRYVTSSAYDWLDRINEDLNRLSKPFA